MSITEKNSIYLSLRRWFPRRIAYKLTMMISC